LTQAAGPPRVEEVAHISLQIGRLLLQNGADTQQTMSAVVGFAAAYECEAHLAVSYEALILTVIAGDIFRTRIGYRVPGMNVGMKAVEGVEAVIQAAARGRLPLSEARTTLDAIDHAPPVYPHWITMIALGVTAASLSRLFGGDWGSVAVAGIAGAAATWPRLIFAAHGVNPVLAAFLVALVGGAIGGAGVHLGVTASAALCLVAPAMILVPGVPLINGVQDVIRGHATLGVSRLGFAATVVAAIAIGLFAAMTLTGVSIPVAGPTTVVGPAEDAIFSALAASGFAVLFGVPLRMAWGCVVCGIASHTSRTLLFGAGIDLITGTLVGSLAAGFGAWLLTRRFHAPQAAFVFPGVVALIPGAYSFRAIIGVLRIAHGTPANAALISDTLSLAFSATLMIAGIAVGVAAPALLPRRRGGRSDAHSPATAASGPSPVRKLTSRLPPGTSEQQRPDL
jgi:uncharacterized membrane protein YjjP (DUF1212 family)